MKNKFPSSWDEEKVKRVITHYEHQSEDEAVAEDEEAFKHEGLTFIEVPVELVPKIRELILQYQ